MENRVPEREFVRIGELIHNVESVKMTVQTALIETPNLGTSSSVMVEQLLTHALQTLEEALSLLKPATPLQKPMFTDPIDKTLLKRTPEILSEIIKPEIGTTYLGMFNGQEIMTDHFGITISSTLAAQRGVVPGDSVRATVSSLGAVFLEKV